MFLRRRSTQAEYFDTQRSGTELAGFYRSLNSLNRLFIFAEPFQRNLPALLGPNSCRRASILDLGSGDGLLAQTLRAWAGKRGWDWQVLNLDLSIDALKLGTGSRVAASALALPFCDGAFDAVIASQVSHHFSDSEAVRHLKEGWRVCRQGLLVSDLHRNAFLYASLALVFRLRGYPKAFSADGLLSVRRGWRVPELRRIAKAAGLAQARVQMFYGARILLQATKRLEPSCA